MPLITRQSPTRRGKVWSAPTYDASPSTTNHKYIRAGATGAGNGTSWADAWTTFAAVTWARDTTYYIAGGTYDEDVTITTAESGAQWLVLRKANATDNGEDAGWNAAYASTQAVINGRVVFYYGYVEFTGVTGTGTSGHGIRIYTATEPAVGAVVYFSSTTTSPRRLYHLEVEGPGFGTISTGTSGIYWSSAVANSKGFHVRYCWISHATTNGITTGITVGTSYTDYGMLVEDNVLSEMGSDVPAVHGQGMQVSYNYPNAYTIIRNNIFRNVSGTGAIVYMDGASSAHSQSRVYNNVFYYTDLATYNNASPGIISILAEASNTADSIFIYNNTFYNVGSEAVTTVKAQVWCNIVGATNIEAKNNLWVACNFTATHNRFTALSNNDYYLCTGAGVPTGETNQQTESTDPFVNAAGANFRLTGTPNAASNGLDLSSVFTTDADGVTRTAPWAIGAFENL